MTSPIETIRVACPACGETYEAWHRRSINLDLDHSHEHCIRQAATATHRSCRHIVELGALVVRDGMWVTG